MKPDTMMARGSHTWLMAEVDLITRRSAGDTEAAAALEIFDGAGRERLFFPLAYLDARDTRFTDGVFDVEE